MKRKLHLILAFVAITLLFSVSSQPAYSSASLKEPEFQPDTDTHNMSDSQSVSDMVEEFLQSKGWAEGENIKKNGQKFFIGVGTGAIQAPIDHPRYIQSRINAFDKAFLASKQDLVEYLATDIANTTLEAYKEGTFSENESQNDNNAGGQDSVISKLSLLANAKLDKMLQKEGIDSTSDDKEKIDDALAGILSTSEFRNFTQTAAHSLLSGVQVYKCFEGPGEGKGFQIAVISIYSDTLREMATAIYTGKKPKSKAPKKPIINQIPKDKKVLLQTFGVQQKIDENGDLVIIAYAQGAPISESSHSISKSYRKAKTAGLGYIRKFAGENYRTTNDAINAETTTEYEDETKSYKDQSKFDEIIQSTSASLKISGIRTIKKWHQKHPLTGKTVTGVILAWSPKSAASAQSLRAKMNSTPGKQSQKLRNASYGRRKLDHAGLTGSGAEADEEAF